MPTGAGERIAWRIAGSAVALLMLAIGTANAVGALAHETSRVHRIVAAPVEVVDVSTSTAGSISVVGGDAGGPVTVDMTVSRGLETPSHSEIVQGDRLVVRSSCLWIVSAFCQVDYVIHVPPGVSVIARAGGDDIRVSNVHGDLDLGSDGGGITVLGGEAQLVRLDSDGGDIATTDLSVVSIEASTDGGDVFLSLDSAPTSVDASADGGDVEIVLPDTPDAYRVDVSSDGGGTEAAVRTDPTSDRVITASSDGGDVIVRYATS
jgi:hypothetical protein